MIKNSSLAVALSYDERLNTAPEVSALGRQELARTMVSVARRAGVPIIEYPELANRLSQVEADWNPFTGSAEIPSSLYYEVAKLLAKVNK